MSNQTYTYQFVDLAAPPTQLIDRALSVDRDQQNIAVSHQFSDHDEKIYAARVLNHNQQQIQHVRQTRYNLDSDWQQWIRDNIANNFIECTVSIGGPSQGHLGPHTDRARDFVLLYVLVPGGENVLTTFWQEHNQSVLRPHATLVDDYQQLSMISEVDLGVRRWVVLDSRILHSVQNLQGSRINIQIAFDDLSELEKRTGPLNFYK